jgi:hypothetical protein
MRLFTPAVWEAFSHGSISFGVLPICSGWLNYTFVRDNAENQIILQCDFREILLALKMSVFKTTLIKIKMAIFNAVFI